MLRSLRRPLSILLFALLSAGVGATFAQNTPPKPTGNPLPPALQGIAKMIRAGELTRALEVIERHLKTENDSVQGLFLRGVVLAEMKRVPEAIDAFSTLIARYPQLPEPYNNLAVLHAANGQLHKAREALEQAIANNPESGLVHENLGDVYARLAAQLYERATTLQPNNRDARAKLAFIRDLAQGKVNATSTRPNASPNSINNGDQK